MDGYGEESDDWMDVEQRREFINMKETPGQIECFFEGKPIKQRSKYNKTQYWFKVKLVTNKENGATGDRILSTGSKKLRAGLKAQMEKYPTLLNGDILVYIQWTGEGMDRSYDVAVVENPWK